MFGLKLQKSRKFLQSTMGSEEKRFVEKMKKKMVKLKKQNKKIRRIAEEKDEIIQSLKEKLDEYEKKELLKYSPKKVTQQDIKLEMKRATNDEVLHAVKTFGDGISCLSIEDCSDIDAQTFVELFAHCNKLERLTLKHVGQFDTIFLNEELTYLDISHSSSLCFIKEKVPGGRYVLNTLLMDNCDMKIDIPFGAYKSLKTISMANCQHIDDDEIEISEGPNWNVHLENLNIRGSDITDFGVKSLAEICPNIRELNISKTKRLTDNGVKHVEMLSKLESLSVGHCQQLTAKTFDFLAAGSKNLRKLDVTGNRNMFPVSSNSVEIISVLSKLEVVNLSSIPLKEFFLGRLVGKLPMLTEVDVSWNNCCDNWALAEMGKKIPVGFHTMNISHTRVDDFGVKDFIKHTKKNVVMKKFVCEKMGDRFSKKSASAITERWKNCEVLHSLK